MARMDWSLNSLSAQLPFPPRSAQSPGARATPSSSAPRMCVVIGDKAGLVAAEFVSPKSKSTDDVFGVRCARFHVWSTVDQANVAGGRVGQERKGCVGGSLAGDMVGN